MTQDFYINKFDSTSNIVELNQQINRLNELTSTKLNFCFMFSMPLVAEDDKVPLLNIKTENFIWKAEFKVKEKKVLKVEIKTSDQVIPVQYA